MIQTKRVMNIMLKLDRGEFWGSDGPGGKRILNPESYNDRPQ